MAKKATKTINGTVLTITFEDGQIVTCDAAQLSDEIKARLMMHGLSQKAGDSYAGAETAQEAFDSAAGVVKDLLEGNWSTRVASGGPKATMLAEALAAATGRTVAEAATVLAGMDEDSVDNLRKHAAVSAHMKRIRAERAIKAAEKAGEAAKGAPDLSSLGL